MKIGNLARIPYCSKDLSCPHLAIITEFGMLTGKEILMNLFLANPINCDLVKLHSHHFIKVARDAPIAQRFKSRARVPVAWVRSQLSAQGLLDAISRVL